MHKTFGIEIITFECCRSPKVRENFEHSVSSAATMATEDDLTPRAPSDLEEEVPGQRKFAWTKDEEQEVDDK